MDRFEFELRYISFLGLSKKFSLGREESEIIDLVRISDRGIPDRKIQEISPEQLKELTKKSYSTYKKKFLSKTQSHSLPHANLDQYIHRLEYELKVIKEMGFNTYMLIVADFVNRARANKIMVGPGRGSGAGSLLARVTGITDINPFAYDLLFERFLNPARITMPDFDIDFEDTLREEVIQYVTKKYGEEKVCYIGTYMKLATKAAFKDAARALGLPFDRANKISAILPEKLSLQELVDREQEFEEIHALYTSDKNVKKALELGAKLEGNLRQTGVHACGFIIAPQNITKYTAVQPLGKGNTGMVSQYDGPTLETIGLLKMDFLGLRNLSVIKNCIKIIAARHASVHDKQQENIDAICYAQLSDFARTVYTQKQLLPLFKNFLETMHFEPALDDSYTYEKVFQKGDTSGIFQFEGQGMRRFLVDLEPNTINDLIAMNALYRPGPLEFIPTYIKRKHGEEEIEYMLPELQEILEKNYPDQTQLIDQERNRLIEDLDPIMGLTYGIAVYQEQLMFLVQAMAGFSLPEADLLRRGVGKKKKHVIEKLKKEFIERSQSYRGYTPETAKIIYEKMIEPAASYSFNKSHAACYSHIAYQTGFLKAHFPIEFYAALLRSVEEDTDKLSFFIDEVTAHGLRISPPCVNVSYNHVAAIRDEVRLGFLSCKGIGYSVGEYIEKERGENGKFDSLEDFLRRCKPIVHKKVLESLIQSGALDDFHDRKTMRENKTYILDWLKSGQTQQQGGLFGDMVDTSIQFPQTYTTSTMEKLIMDTKIFKTFVSGHPFDGLYPLLKKENFISQFKDTPESGEFRITAYVKKIQRAKKKGYFVTLEDATDSMEVFWKDTMDIRPFDIFRIQGYRGKSITIDHMIKISHQALIEKAKKANRYDASRTIARVQQARNSTTTLRDTIQKHQTSSIDSTNNPTKQAIPSSSHSTPPSPTEQKTNTIKKEQKKSKKTHTEQEQVSQQEMNTHIPMPDTISAMQKIMEIVRKHPGEQQIYIGSKTAQISSQGHQKLWERVQENKEKST